MIYRYYDTNAISPLSFYSVVTNRRNIYRGCSYKDGKWVLPQGCEFRLFEKVIAYEEQKDPMPHYIRTVDPIVTKRISPFSFGETIDTTNINSRESLINMFLNDFFHNL